MSDAATNPPVDGEERTDALAGRRRFMTATAAVVPIVASLPGTAAALARSSNVITATWPADAKDALGRTLCLDGKSGTARYDRAIDLGQPPSGWVSAVNERDYLTEPKGSAARVSEGDMCNNGGTYYYQNAGWRQVTVPRGMLVSATALTSFAGRISVTDI